MGLWHTAGGAAYFSLLILGFLIHYLFGWAKQSLYAFYSSRAMLWIDLIFFSGLIMNLSRGAIEGRRILILDDSKKSLEMGFYLSGQHSFCLCCKMLLVRTSFLHQVNRARRCLATHLPKRWNYWKFYLGFGQLCLRVYRTFL